MNAELVGEGPVGTGVPRHSDGNENGGKCRRPRAQSNLMMRHALQLLSESQGASQRPGTQPPYCRRRLTRQSRKANGATKKLSPLGAVLHPEELVAAWGVTVMVELADFVPSRMAVAVAW